MSSILAILVVLMSLWALHRFCDGYTVSTLNAWPGSDDLVEPAEAMCTRWLGSITYAGARGVFSLAGGLLLLRLSASKRWVRLSSWLGVAGRLVALIRLGATLLVVVLFNRF